VPNFRNHKIEKENFGVDLLSIIGPHQLPFSPKERLGTLEEHLVPKLMRKTPPWGSGVKL